MVAVEPVLDVPALAGYRMTAVVHAAVAGMAVVEATVGFVLADRSYAPVLSPNTHTKRRINYQGDDYMWEEQKGYGSVERGLRFIATRQKRGVFFASVPCSSPALIAVRSQSLFLRSAFLAATSRDMVVLWVKGICCHG